ncbi:hypothetical protein INT46_004974 [Mucor plumbeus]|uniref:Ubiquitin-like domain-containing protein n=1 Tax=Mucor plumbeus TaxID=97098 RepID=A0A8H7VGW4_9FUNG|nr:hypothetical protein INT46_004974 [Mucor plumbeus]
MVSFEIKWGTKRFPIELTQDEFDTIKVSNFKVKCQQLTEVEPQYMKLLAYGAILKNDEELLKNYKIVQGSKIMLMGSKTHISPLKTPPKADAPIATRLLWTRNLRESVLKPDIKLYEKQANEQLSQSSPEPKQTNQLINYGNYMHEKLMHILQQLDTMPEVNDKERLERKENVKETEALLDLIESIKTKLNGILK